ncbi:hypothetical protein LCGC14_0965970 [marine sediment metagenome]|uniref:Uncharacterized protein n=1 Tax=marine sediment metagenome TaxID=412755 RepID=A0A0F9NZ86_9ZZZZ
MALYHPTGPCTITFAGQVLGKTKAGVNISPKVTWAPVVVDALGAAPAGYIYSGKSCVVDMTLVEFNVSGNVGFQKFLDAWLPGGLLGHLQGVAGDPCLVGETARTCKGADSGGDGITRTLNIYEEVAAKNWTSAIAFMLDPAELLLAATSEQIIPVSFVIIPDDTTNLLFSVQDYLR